MTTATPASKTSMIFAGEIFDGSDEKHPKIRDLEGNLHTVRVRAMPGRHIGKVLAVCTDEAALIELVSTVAIKDDKTGEVIDWVPVDATFVDNVDDASHLLLVEAAQRQNFSRASTWGRRQIEAKKFQAPLLLQADEMLSPVVEKMAHLLISSLRSSESQAKPSTKS
jgi:hypothetical protein